MPQHHQHKSVILCALRREVPPCGHGIVTNADVRCDPGWPQAASGRSMGLMLARMGIIQNVPPSRCADGDSSAFDSQPAGQDAGFRQLPISWSFNEGSCD
jgi:hypothetical protein